MADALKDRVASGAYASESEVVRDGLRALFAREEAVENWLRTEVLASIEAVDKNPSSVISSEDMRTVLMGLRSKNEAEQVS
jgi:putative addiction module CopG family antidote